MYLRGICQIASPSLLMFRQVISTRTIAKIEKANPRQWRGLAIRCRQPQAVMASTFDCRLLLIPQSNCCRHDAILSVLNFSKASDFEFTSSFR